MSLFFICTAFFRLFCYSIHSFCLISYVHFLRRISLIVADAHFHCKKLSFYYLYKHSHSYIHIYVYIDFFAVIIALVCTVFAIIIFIFALHLTSIVLCSSQIFLLSNDGNDLLYYVVVAVIIVGVKLSPSSLGIIFKGIPLSNPLRCACPIYTRYVCEHIESRPLPSRCTCVHTRTFIYIYQCVYVYVCVSVYIISVEK